MLDSLWNDFLCAWWFTAVQLFYSCAYFWIIKLLPEKKELSRIKWLLLLSTHRSCPLYCKRVSRSNLKTLVLLSSFVFCDNGDILDEGFITDLLGLEWLAGAFLHLHECHFHTVRNAIAKCKKPYGVGFLTNSLMFVQCRRQNSEGIVQPKMQRNYNTEVPRPA